MLGAGGFEGAVVKNHDHKLKNMQRSVLPSTNREWARGKRRRIHKRARARQRDALADARKAMAGASTVDGVDLDPDFREGRRKSATHWMVGDRRACDKIGSLTRWAVRTVEHDPDLRDAALEDQVAYFKALLPGDLIGKHAVFHIEWALKWKFHRSTLAGWRPGDNPRGASGADRRARVAADAHRILEAGRHRELNVTLRRAYDAGLAVPPHVWRPVPERSPRLLAGLHDVEDFADDVSRFPQVCETIAEVAGRSRDVR